MPTHTLITIGRLKAPDPLHALQQEYRKRLGSSLRLIEIDARRCRTEATTVTEILGAASHSALILFDERGKSLASLEFAQFLQTQTQLYGALTFVIGGANGLPASLKQQATQLLALGPATWPHRLARVMVLEQLYRAQTINAGHPYHRS